MSKITMRSGSEARSRVGCIHRQNSAAVRLLNAVNRKAKDFYDFSSDEVTAFARKGAFAIIEPGLWQQVDSIAAHHGFPIQAIGLIQQFFDGFRGAGNPYRRADQCVNVIDILVLAGFII